MTEFLRAVKPLLPLIPIGLIVLAVAVAGLAAWRTRRGAARSKAWGGAVVDAGLVGSLLAIAILTLLPSIDAGRSVEWVPFSGPGGGIHVAERTANLVLFVPFGFFLPLRFPRFDTPARTALAGFLLSVTIEVLQYVLALGRQSSATDVVMDTAGVVSGWALLFAGRAAVRLARPRVSASR